MGLWSLLAGTTSVGRMWKMPLSDGAGGVPCFLNTASIAALAHFSQRFHFGPRHRRATKLDGLLLRLHPFGEFQDKASENGCKLPRF